MLPAPCFRITRRGFLVGGAAALASGRGLSSAPSCTLVPEQEEGPYYIDDERLRRDIAEDKPGVALKLRIALVDAARCAPLPNAAVDIWHCDAMGVYSGFTSGGFGGPDGGPGGPPPMGPPPGPGRMGPPPGRRKIDATRFLRGVQLTGPDGGVEFATIYPGWYLGRAIHIHLKVHLSGHVSHTGQIFLPEEVTADVAKLTPYAARLPVHRTLQSEDHVFNGQRGAASMAGLSRLRSGSNADGFLATVTLAIDPQATPAPVHGFGRR